MRSAPKKKAILDATRDLLVKHGGPKLTMRKVADHAGISLGNLQYHFAKREILLQALLNDFLIEYEDSLAQLAAHPRGKLIADLEELFLSVFTDPEFEACGVVFKELWAESQHHLEMKAAMTAYYQRLSSFYVAFFSEVSGISSTAPELARAVSIVVPLLEGVCITGNVSSSTNKQVSKSWASIIAAVLTGKV